jgi:type IV fimbrial biogenesis protein FimU
LKNTTLPLVRRKSPDIHYIETCNLSSITIFQTKNGISLMDFSSGLTRTDTRHSWHGPHGGKSRGFTLIELIVVVVIVGIFAAMAMPMFSSSLHRSNVNSAANELYDLLQYARAEAVTRGTTVTIQAPSLSSSNWTGNVTVTAPNSLTLRQVGTTGLQSGIAIATGVGSIVFTPTGNASSQACFQLTYATDSNVPTKFIGVQASGRVTPPSTVRPGEC